MEFLFENIIYIYSQNFVCHFLNLLTLKQKMIYEHQDSDHNKIYDENNFQNVGNSDSVKLPMHFFNIFAIGIFQKA